MLNKSLRGVIRVQKAPPVGILLGKSTESLAFCVAVNFQNSTQLTVHCAERCSNILMFVEENVASPGLDSFQVPLSDC